MKDPFASDSGIDSPARESLKNTEGCYNTNIFKSKSFANSRRALQSSAEKISRTFRSVRNTFGNLSQHFRLGGRRRHRLTEAGSPCRTPSTPVTKKKQVLGRSPTRLYSPFGIETPHSRDFRMSPYMPDTPEHGLSPKRRKGVHSWHILSKKRPRALFRPRDDKRGHFQTVTISNPLSSLRNINSKNHLHKRKLILKCEI